METSMEALVFLVRGWLGEQCPGLIWEALGPSDQPAVRDQPGYLEPGKHGTTPAGGEKVPVPLGPLGMRALRAWGALWHGPSPSG